MNCRIRNKTTSVSCWALADHIDPPRCSFSIENSKLILFVGQAFIKGEAHIQLWRFCFVIRDRWKDSEIMKEDGGCDQQSLTDWNSGESRNNTIPFSPPTSSSGITETWIVRRSLIPFFFKFRRASRCWIVTHFMSCVPLA